MRRISIKQKWHQQSEAAKNAAQKLPHGKERDALVRMARQLETASKINQWLSSAELKPPE
jgi:archaellum biogenesis protein FlaJ (TadC family)